MKVKWNVFAAATLIAWIFLVANRAPLLPVALGTIVVALWNWRAALRRP